MFILKDRIAAGQLLSEQLSDYALCHETMVIALPRGGVPVAYEIAKKIQSPLDLWIVRKLGAPYHPELAIGAIALGGTLIKNNEIIKMLGVTSQEIEQTTALEKQELIRRNQFYRQNMPIPSLAGKTVIVVDDGLATGATMHAAILDIKKMNPRHIIIAVPVASAPAFRLLRPLVYDIVTLAIPEPFEGVGAFYEDFSQLEDEEVIRLLNLAKNTIEKKETAYQENVQLSINISVDNITLKGELYTPSDSKGLIIFAHGSGSSRLSPRNQYVANILNEAKFTTLLFDLLTAEEEQADLLSANLRFNIPFLTKRLVKVTNWLNQQYSFQSLKIGYFGASTGAAAAIMAAAECPQIIKAVVSRGGRPDLAEQALERVAAAILLVVGGNDPAVLELNQQALQKIASEKNLVVIPNATHLFEESGALEQAAKFAVDWFNHYLQ